MTGPAKQNQSVHYGFNKALLTGFFALLIFLALPVFTVRIQATGHSLNFSANPSSINSGQPATLTWSGTRLISCEATGAWSGNKAISGSEIVRPSQNSNYTLTCRDGLNFTVTIAKSVTVTVIPTSPTPTTPNSFFFANPSSINLGESSTLTWSDKYRAAYPSCIAGGGWSNEWSGDKSTGGGSEIVRPSKTSFYTLSCFTSSLSSNRITESVTVTVIPTSPTPDEEVISRENKDKGSVLNVPNPVKADNLTDLLTDVANFIFIIAIPISVIVILISGIRYLFAGGNEDKIKAARQALIWAAVGLVIILIGKGIISVIQGLLSVTIK